MRTGMILVALLTSVAWGGSTLAVTLVETESGGERVVTYLSGAKMRSESPSMQGYVLMDLKERTYYMVNPEQGMVMDMSGLLQQKRTAGKQGEAVAVIFEERGAGPVIAGYPTRHFLVSANGQQCLEMFVSRQAMEDVGSSELLALADDLDQESGFGGGPCATPKLHDADFFREHGYPLREIAADGTVTEVVRILPDAPAPPGGFDLPPGYPVRSMDQMFGGYDGSLPATPPSAPESGQAGDDPIKGMLDALKQGFGN